jgi:hypothetical protein
MLRRGIIAGATRRVKLICVLHPMGPLPAPVYWRRRVLVLAAALAAILVLWLLTGSSQPDTGSGQSAAGPVGNTTPAGTTTLAGTTAPPGAATSSPAAPSETLVATPPAVDPGRPGDGDAGAQTPSGSAASTEAAVPPTCPDGALRLVVAPGRPDYPVGALPQITLSVRNVSRGTCSRDLAASQQEVLLYAGRTRLWSSNDCYPGGGQDIQALAPGEHDSYSVTWSGLSSQPKCAGHRSRVGPGRYSLIARIGTLRSPPAALTLR